MPPALQVKLLRVLESGQVRRVGGEEDALVLVERGPEERQRTVAVPWSLRDPEAPAQLVLGISRHSLDRLKDFGDE